jgi:hypothetical protein
MATSTTKTVTSGKTPEASIASRLATGAAKGEFVRTAPATYTLPGKAPAKGKSEAEAKLAAEPTTDSEAAAA